LVPIQAWGSEQFLAQPTGPALDWVANCSGLPLEQTLLLQFSLLSSDLPLVFMPFLKPLFRNALSVKGLF
jgi:hypothetical protein